MSILILMILSVIMGFSVLIGVHIAFKYRINHKILATLVGFVIGIIGGTIFLELLDLRRGVGYIYNNLLWFILGVVIFWFIINTKPRKRVSEKGSNMNIGLVLVIAIIFDDMIEGLTLAVTGIISIVLVLTFFLVIVFQNVVEGIIEGVEELEEGWSRKQIVGLNLGAAVAPVISAMVGSFLFSRANMMFFNFSITFLAGALFSVNCLYIGKRLEWNNSEIIGCLIGIAVIVVLSVFT